MMSEDEPCKGSRVPTEEKAACVMVPRQERVRKESWLTAANMGRLTNGKEVRK